MIRYSEPTNDFLAALENMPERGEGRLHNYTMGLCNKGINAGLTADQLYDILEPLRPWRPNELESTIQKAEEEASDWRGNRAAYTYPKRRNAHSAVIQRLPQSAKSLPKTENVP